MWTTIADLAESLGVSRRSLERALDADGSIDTPAGPVRVQQRPATAEDYDTLGITRRTTRLVSVVGDDVEREIDRAYDDVVNGVRTAEDRLRWLDDIATGKARRVIFTSKGEKFDNEEFSESARLTANWQAQKIQEYIDERDRNYLHRMDVANAFAAVGSLFRDRMQSIPARLADKLSGIRSVADIRARLAEAIDEILLEVADAGERELAALLEGNDE